MTHGRQTCKILKEIRRQIAEANDIQLVIDQCQYQGDCAGTCPKCESEVRYLEQQLRLRRLSGKAVALMGLSAGLLSLSSCRESLNSTEMALQPAPQINNLERQRAAKSSSVAQICDTPISKGTDTPKIRVPNFPVVSNIGIPESVKIRQKLIDSVDLNKDRLAGIAEEKFPQFPGGESALYEWIKSHIEYPKSALDDSIEGRSVVQFVVKTDGSIGDVRVIRPLHPTLDSEAIRVVKMLPNFQPGQMNGIVVNVWYTLPIFFKLPVNDEKSSAPND